MALSLDHPAHPQLDSPLFSRIPPEIRNHIFKLALTAYEDPDAEQYRVMTHYRRPGFTRPQRIDTSLLLTCRHIYHETSKIPASLNEHISWYWREPPGIKKNHVPIEDRPCSIIRRQELRTVHIFAQQFWLEGYGFAGFTGLWDYACPTTLIITLRHSDWWWWESEDPLTLDPKQEGKASINKHSRPSDPFEPSSWGNQFRKIKGLRKLQLELETVDKKKSELDAIVGRAGGWEFALGDDRVLRLDKSKTRRTAWIGAWLGKNLFISQDLALDGILTETIDPQGGEEDDHDHDHDNDDDDDDDDEEHDEEHESPGPTTTGDTGIQDSITLDDKQTSLKGCELLTHSQNTINATLRRKAREKLEAAGVSFTEDASVEGLPIKASIYYVVTLTWDA
ncbi:MAG: hypothetical protein Q9180_007134 [Flavoplaca navasiana]